MADLEIVPAGHNRWQAVRDGVAWALLKWSGEHQVAFLAGGREVGTLYRSDGRWATGADGQRFIAYTWRAYLPGPGGREVARRVTQAEAVAALIAADPELSVMTQAEAVRA